MARLVVPSFPHHVTQRGNRRQKTFFCEDDYRIYITLLAKFCAKARTRVWAYCLMPNHVHLVMVPSHADGLRGALGEAHRRYTRHVNFREQWRGHLWQERFHSFPMDESYLMATVRYVEQNPVVAKLCRHANDWPWSSAAAHVAGTSDALIEVEPMLGRVQDWRAYLSGTVDDEHRSQVAKHSRTGRPLGNAEFISALERITGRNLTLGRPGRKPRDKK